MPNATPFIKTKEEIVELMLSTFPSGYLYRNNEGLRQIIEGIAQTYYQISKDVQKVFDDLFFINKDNQFLQEFLAEYGLPNIIFPTINNGEQAAFAISMTKQSRLLVSKEDFENFLLLLGYNVKFYHLNTILENSGFDYSFPISFTESLGLKDKITWWIYIESGNEITGEYNGIGDAFDIDFVESSTNVQFVKNILDYLKPDYIIFQYIDAETKALYGI